MQESKFCSYCGSKLEETPVDLEKGVKASSVDSGKRVKASSVVMMFVVDLIPLMGFFAAFIWTYLKFKRKKIGLATFIIAFLAINICATLFVYSSAVSHMKNSLIKAAEEQNIILGNQQPGNVDPTDDAPIQNPLDITPGLSDISPDLSNINPDISDINPDLTDIPYMTNIPQADEEGNTYFDSDGDGINDMLFDKDGNILFDPDGDGVFTPPVFETGKFSD